MAMTTIPRTSLFRFSAYAAGSVATQVLNTTDDWVATLFYWPGGDLTRAGFVFTNAVGSPVCTVQMFDADLSDGGSAWVNTGSAVGAAVDTGTITANSLQTVTGIGGTGLAAGHYAIRVIFKSGTSATLQRGYAAVLGTQIGAPVLITVQDGGAQTKESTVTPSMSVGNGSAWVSIGGIMPAATIANASYADTSNPDEHGLWVPANPWPVSVRVCGVSFLSGASTRPNLRIGFYTGTLASPSQDLAFTLDRDVFINAAASATIADFPTKQTVAAGAAFGIGVRATTTHNWQMQWLDFLTGNEALMDGLWGQQATLFTREADTGALTQSTFKSPFLNVMIDGIDPGSGGSGQGIAQSLHTIGAGISA
jgi:hypothetical protein